MQPTVAGRLTNSFQVLANETDPDLTNNSVAVASTVTNAAGAGVADVSISASVDVPDSTGSPSDALFTISITVSNAGPSVATDVVVSNFFTFDNIGGGGGSFFSATGGVAPTNNILLFHLGSLAVGQTNMIQVVMRGVLESYFHVSADEFDPATNDNFVTVSGSNPTNFRERTVTYETLLASEVDQRTNQFSTELIAKLPDGTVLYDQTFTNGFSDPTVQAAVTQAAALLNGSGASAYTGPTQTSFMQTLVSTSSVTAFSTNSSISAETTTYVGPTSYLGGVIGTYFRFNTNDDYVGPINGSNEILYLLSGQQDIPALITTELTIFQTTTNAATYLNSAVYVMTGVVTQADVSLNVSAAPDPVGVGSNLVYSITVSNAGPDAATGVVISNQLPAGVTFVSASGGATPSGGVLLLNLGSLAVGATNSAQIVVQPTSAGRFTNSFQVLASETDPNVTNNSVPSSPR